MLTNITQITPKYSCEICNFKTHNKKDYDKHLLTRKHEKNSFVNNQLTDFPPTENYTCQQCNKQYNSRVGLWKHNKTCNNTTTNVVSENVALTTIVQDLVKSNQELQHYNDDFKQIIVDQNKNNQELQQQVIELCKTGINTVNSHNNTTTNNNNKSFNLNMFLNETCKDAMNMNEFVDSIIITVGDLEGMGKLGFVNGLSNIIIKNLKAIDYRLRPVHCTDTKRDTVYTKENDKWVKECEDHKNVRRFIQLIAKKNTGNINLFRNKYPDCLDSRSKSSDVYNKIVMETYGGYGNNDHDSEDKIIKKLVKEIAVERH